MKNMNTLYYVLVALLTSSIAIAQPAFQESPAQEYISNRTVDLMDDTNDYTGSPYHNKEFLKGSILVNEKIVALNQDIRYNVTKEEFEILDPNNKESKIVKTIIRDKDISLKIDDISYEYISDSKNGLRGYFIPLFKGEKNALFKKITKKYLPAQKAYNSMASNVKAMYREKELLYLVNGDGVFTELSTSKSKKIKAFGDLKKDVKNYTKEKKLNINKEKDLIQVVSYIDSL